MAPLLHMILFLIPFVLPTPIKIDCHPDPNPNKESCLQRGCLWMPSESHIPSCFFDPAKMPGYDATKVHEGLYHLKRRPTPSIFGNDYQHLKFTWQKVAESILRARICPSQDEGISSSMSEDQDPNFKVDVQLSPFGFSVSRKNSKEQIFDSMNLPGFTFSKQFILLTTRVTTRNLYGIGEQWHPELRRDFNWKRYSLFTKDGGPGPNRNLYGFHPFYMGLDKSNLSYGVYLNNSHGMDYLIQPNPDLLSTRIIGGELDLYFFMGPSSDNVIQQYTSVVGRPLLPPYWSLGFQLSRYGYKNTSDLKKVWDRNRAAFIPQDVQTVDIDYMDGFKDFTYDPVRFKGLPDFVRDQIHASNQKLVLITDPAIASRPKHPYKALELGLQMDIFIKDARTRKPLEAQCWPGDTYWPDFSNPKTLKYWSIMMASFHKSVQFDGIWLDMNDPSSFVTGSLTGCANNSLNYPPYLPTPYQPLFAGTLCLDAIQYLGPHYACHNFYGHHEIKTTYKALDTLFPTKRHHILSRSTSPGSGSFSAHWTGDNAATWVNLNQTIVAMLEFNMFGIPFTGTDICGFGTNTTEELCLRWSQLGAFYPYARNHNDKHCFDQDPAVWGGKTTAAIRESLELRYSLLPYMYTLFYDAHTNGTTVMKPLFFEFPNDANVWNLHEQFLYGPSLMIIPILEKNKTSKDIYVNKGTWYNVADNYKMIIGPTRGYRLSIPKDSIGILMREKSIIPWQKKLHLGNSTADWRKQPFGLSVSVQTGSKGKLFWDDGESKDSISSGKYCLIKFQTNCNKTDGILEIWDEIHACQPMPKLQYANFAGMMRKPKEMSLDGKPIDKRFISFKGNALYLSGQNITLDKEERTVITWKF